MGCLLSVGRVASRLAGFCLIPLSAPPPFVPLFPFLRMSCRVVGSRISRGGESELHGESRYPKRGGGEMDLEKGEGFGGGGQALRVLGLYIQPVLGDGGRGNSCRLHNGTLRMRALLPAVHMKRTWSCMYLTFTAGIISLAHPHLPHS